jgi:hypothetical protein
VSTYSYALSVTVFFAMVGAAAIIALVLVRSVREGDAESAWVSAVAFALCTFVAAWSFGRVMM